jgi:hypothetical protein
MLVAATSNSNNDIIIQEPTTINSNRFVLCRWKLPIFSIFKTSWSWAHVKKTQIPMGFGNPLLREIHVVTIERAPGIINGLNFKHDKTQSKNISEIENRNQSTTHTRLKDAEIRKDATEENGGATTTTTAA